MKGVTNMPIYAVIYLIIGLSFGIVLDGFQLLIAWHAAKFNEVEETTVGGRIIMAIWAIASIACSALIWPIRIIVIACRLIMCRLEESKES